MNFVKLFLKYHFPGNTCVYVFITDFFLHYEEINWQTIDVKTSAKNLKEYLLGCQIMVSSGLAKLPNSGAPDTIWR